MKNEKRRICFRSSLFAHFVPLFMTVYHIPLQNIPEIWRVIIHAVPLLQKFVKRCNFIWRCCVKQKTRKQEGEKTTYNPARTASMFAGVAAGGVTNGISIHGNSPQMLQWRVESRLSRWQNRTTWSKR